MKVYILISEWCNSTESGYDIQEVCDNKQDALQAMFTTHMDFIRDCDHNEFPDFEEYDIEQGESEITVYSKRDHNLYEMLYVIEKEIS